MDHLRETAKGKQSLPKREALGTSTKGAIGAEPHEVHNLPQITLDISHETTGLNGCPSTF